MKKFAESAMITNKIECGDVFNHWIRGRCVDVNVDELTAHAFDVFE